MNSERHAQLLLDHLKTQGGWCATRQIKQSIGIKLSEMNRAVDRLKDKKLIIERLVAGKRMFCILKDGQIATPKINPDWRDSTLEDHGADRAYTNLAMLHRH